jgi:hypothetical protein
MTISLPSVSTPQSPLASLLPFDHVSAVGNRCSTFIDVAVCSPFIKWSLICNIILHWSRFASPIFLNGWTPLLISDHQFTMKHEFIFSVSTLSSSTVAQKKWTQDDKKRESQDVTGYKPTTSRLARILLLSSCVRACWRSTDFPI